MQRRPWRAWVACAIALASRSSVVLSQDMVMDHGQKAADSTPKLFGGASGILFGTRQSPAIDNRTLTEGYLSQPMLMGSAEIPRYDLSLAATVNFEGLTLQRGELNPGISGEGYVDRRHPHTYLHEVVATWQKSVVERARFSVTAGKGFATFGTDDPMVRPFVHYPLNHHLSQILERAVVAGAGGYGPVAVEFSRFNGDEPEFPSDFPNSDRLFDSWAGRASAHFRGVLEIQGSFASVVSPEVAAGGGLDQKKWSASARYESGGEYALAEVAQTQEFESSRDAFEFLTMLAEGSVTRARATLSARVEQTDRPEEERTANPFRTPRPESDLSILGRTRWTVVTVNASREFAVSRAKLSPFVEVGRAHVKSLDRFSVFDPATFHGPNNLWSISAGVRFGLGMVHHRMGRYGAALQKGAMKMDDMAMGQ
ncbi:MAG: hypothetical protein ABIQ55_13690 [Gemmatimonadaceae bacterium]